MTGINATREMVKVFGKFLVTLWLKNQRSFRIYESANIINNSYKIVIVIMKNEFWIEKWEQNQTGFHKHEVHPLLVKYSEKLQLKVGDTVFVPLCGKTLDMLWLHGQGFIVIGVQLSKLAVIQFFEENKLAFEKSFDGRFHIYTHKNIHIYQGDFFDLTHEDCKAVNAVYDRAALIALPDGLVQKYVQKMQTIIPKAARELLITLELQRTTTDALGPPFSVPDDKVRTLFADYASIPGFQNLGCAYVYERVYLIEN